MTSGRDRVGSDGRSRQSPRDGVGAHRRTVWRNGCQLWKVPARARRSRRTPRSAYGGPRVLPASTATRPLNSLRRPWTRGASRSVGRRPARRRTRATCHPLSTDARGEIVIANHRDTEAGLYEVDPLRTRTRRHVTGDILCCPFGVPGRRPLTGRRVVILGGGMAGLAAAWELSRPEHRDAIDVGDRVRARARASAAREPAAAASTGASRNTGCTSGSATTTTPSGWSARSTTSSTVRAPTRTARSGRGATPSGPPTCRCRATGTGRRCLDGPSFGRNELEPGDPGRPVRPVTSPSCQPRSGSAARRLPFAVATAGPRRRPAVPVGLSPTH